MVMRRKSWRVMDAIGLQVEFGVRESDKWVLSELRGAEAF